MPAVIIDGRRINLPSNNSAEAVIAELSNLKPGEVWEFRDSLGGGIQGIYIRIPYESAVIVEVDV